MHLKNAPLFGGQTEITFLKSILSEGDHKTGRVERFYRPEKIDETSIVMKSSITGFCSYASSRATPSINSSHFSQPGRVIMS